MNRQIYFYKMPSTLLKVDGLSLSSANGFIVENLSFDIGRGEIIALTGRSGSGKTSIALAILGLLPEGIKQQAGTIYFSKEDETVQSIPGDLIAWVKLRGSHIGYIQQDVFGAFDPVIKMGRQMLMIINERSLRSHNHEDELKSSMAEVGITDIDRIWNSYPHQLSGGQLQRCLLCISIVIRPALLIADEPTSAIDKVNQVELMDLFAHVRKKYKMAILCITHEPAVVQYLADREIKLEEMILKTRQRVSAGNAMKKNESPKLEVINIGYAHRFGGLIEKKGARVGGISFSISGGKCLGVVGESGSGKSTLAQMLVGLLIPAEGEIRIEGRKIDFRSVEDLRFLRSKVQLVMQDGRGSLHPNKSIRTLLAEVINQLQKKDKLIVNIESVLREVGLPGHVLNRKSGNLSGGECLRVCIARALLIEPDVLICDESTSALDVPTRDDIMDLLQSLIQHRNLGLIVISHDGSLIRRMADEIVVLSEGQIIERGSAEDLALHAASPVSRKIFSTEATLSQKKTL
jgi:peptide/nickel transport system ATP-binding protein